MKPATRHKMKIAGGLRQGGGEVNMPSLTERQKRVSEWAVERFGARKSGTCCLLQVQAHLGYLTRLHLSDHSGLEPALGDLMLHLLDYCEARNIDLDAALNKAMVRKGILLDRWREKH